MEGQSVDTHEFRGDPTGGASADFRDLQVGGHRGLIALQVSRKREYKVQCE